MAKTRVPNLSSNPSTKKSKRATLSSKNLMVDVHGIEAIITRSTKKRLPGLYILKIEKIMNKHKEAVIVTGKLMNREKISGNIRKM